MAGPQRIAGEGVRFEIDGHDYGSAKGVGSSSSLLRGVGWAAKPLQSRFSFEDERDGKRFEIANGRSRRMRDPSDGGCDGSLEIRR